MNFSPKHRSLTIAQVGILLASATQTVVVTDVQPKPLTNLIRKGLVTLREDTSSKLILVILTPKGKTWLDRAAKIQKAWENYANLSDVTGAA